MKANLENLKNEIKNLVAIQISTKEQRKTVKFNGTRTMEPWEATYKAQNQRDVLRYHYKAYAILRGQDPSSHNLKTGEEYWEKTSVEALVKKYSNEEAVCNN